MNCRISDIIDNSTDVAHFNTVHAVHNRCVIFGFIIYKYWWEKSNFFINRLDNTMNFKINLHLEFFNHKYEFCVKSDVYFHGLCIAMIKYKIFGVKISTIFSIIPITANNMIFMAISYARKSNSISKCFYEKLIIKLLNYYYCSILVSWISYIKLDFKYETLILHDTISLHNDIVWEFDVWFARGRFGINVHFQFDLGESR